MCIYHLKAEIISFSNMFLTFSLNAKLCYQFTRRFHKEETDERRCSTHNGIIFCVCFALLKLEFSLNIIALQRISMKTKMYLHFMSIKCKRIFSKLETYPFLNSSLLQLSSFLLVTLWCLLAPLLQRLVLLVWVTR